MKGRVWLCGGRWTVGRPRNPAPDVLFPRPAPATRTAILGTQGWPQRWEKTGSRLRGDRVVKRIGRTSRTLKEVCRATRAQTSPLQGGPSALKKVDDQHDHGNDQEQMDVPSEGIGRDEAEEPEHDQDHKDRPQHGAFLWMKSLHVSGCVNMLENRPFENVGCALRSQRGENAELQGE